MYLLHIYTVKYTIKTHGLNISSNIVNGRF